MLKKSFRILLLIGLLTVLMGSLLIIKVPVISASNGSFPHDRPVLYVDPADNSNKTVGDAVTVSVKIFNLTTAKMADPKNPLKSYTLGNLFGLDLNFTWDPAVLTYISHTVTIPVETYPEGVLHTGAQPPLIIKDNVSISDGWYKLAVTCLDVSNTLPFNNPNASSTVFRMTFNVSSAGASFLRFTFDDLSDSLAFSIPRYRKDYSRGGIYVTIGAQWDSALFPGPRDGHIASVGTPWPEFSYWPEDYAVVDRPVVFDASESYDTDGNITEYSWDFSGNGSMVTTDAPIINHTYTSVATYQAALRVKDDSGLESLRQVKEVKVVSKRELVISEVKAPRIVTQNETTSIQYTVNNNGSVIERVVISAYINTTVFQFSNPAAAEWQLIWSDEYSLALGNKPSSFTWTANVSTAYYYVKVNVTNAPYENVADNTAYSEELIFVTTERVHDMVMESLAVRVAGTTSATDFAPPVMIGEDIKFTPQLLNNGSVLETYNVTLEIIAPNSSVVGQLEWLDYSLDPGETGTLSPSNVGTSGWEHGNYTANANVTTLEADVKPEDNTLSVIFKVIQPPTLVVTAPTTGFVNENVTVSATNSTYPDGTFVKFEWSIYQPDSLAYGGDPDFTGEGLTLSFIPSFTGRWDIVLVVIDSDGITYSLTRSMSSFYRKQAVVTVQERSPWPIDPLYIVLILIIVIVVIVVLYLLWKRSKRK